MPFGVLCYCMMWSSLPDATPAALKFLWYLFMYSFFQTCMTVRNVVPGAGCLTQQPVLQGMGPCSDGESQKGPGGEQ